MGSSCTCLLQMQHGLSYPGNTVLGPGTYVPGKHKPELPPLRGIAQLNKTQDSGEFYSSTSKITQTKTTRAACYRSHTTCRPKRRYDKHYTRPLSNALHGPVRGFPQESPEAHAARSPPGRGFASLDGFY